MTTRWFACFGLLFSAAVTAADAPVASPPAEGGRNVTFVSTSDSHYDTQEDASRNERNRDTLRHLNAISDLTWPETVGGKPIQKPRGVLLLGDVIDDGDKVVQGVNQSAIQYDAFLKDFGLDGTDGLLKFPVYEGFGNHDGPPVGKEKNGFSFQARLKERNAARLSKRLISNLSENGLHYSWDWDDVHFVQLNLYPADVQHPRVRYNRTWHHPQDALKFLKEDLAKNVGTSGRPVVLLSHCGFDTDWWVAEDWKAMYDAGKPYNIVLFLYGHTGTGVRPWAPPGEDRKWLTINDGQTENGFFVISLDREQLRYAFRCKVWKTEPQPEGKPKKTWTGEWIWKWAGSAKLAS